MEPATKKWKIGTRRHLKEWKILKGQYEGLIESSKKGQDYSYCVPCKKDIKVTASGFYDLESHFRTTKHAENLAISKTFKPVNMHFALKKESNTATTEAEVKFCHFIAEHNIPFNAADYFSDLVKPLFPDSKIAKVRVSISNFRHQPLIHL